uniref:Uncharacterized protein n=1 Tax=Calcidiscus leptoporus TaxID=127549 RepID=A0A7S0IWT7_9EUKA
MQLATNFAKEKERALSAKTLLEHMKDEASRAREEVRRAEGSQQQLRSEIASLQADLASAQADRAQLVFSFRSEREALSAAASNKESEEQRAKAAHDIQTQQEVAKLQAELSAAHAAKAQLSEGFASESEEMVAMHAQRGEELERLRSELEQERRMRAEAAELHAREADALREAAQRAENETQSLICERDEMLEAHTAVILDLHKAHGNLSGVSAADVPTAFSDLSNGSPALKRSATRPLEEGAGAISRFFEVAPFDASEMLVHLQKRIKDRLALTAARRRGAESVAPALGKSFAGSRIEGSADDDISVDIPPRSPHYSKMME